MASSKLILTIAVLYACFALGMTDSKPIMVIDLFRHGARAAYDDRWDTTKAWTGKLGELTNAGMRMHYLLGKALAQDYPHLLGTYDPSQITVFSTDVNRTIMSAYSQLFGMFSPGAKNLTDYQNKTAVPPGLETYNFTEFLPDNYPLPNGIQPVPVHIIAHERDYALAADAGCTNFQQAKVDALNATAYTDFMNTLNDTVNMIKSYAAQYNISLPDIWSYGILADTLITNYFENITAPVNVTYGSKEWNDLMFFNDWVVTYLYTGQLKNLRLMSYNLFQRQFDLLNGKLKGKFNKKFALLSAHDTTLLPMLAGLGVVTPQCLMDNYLGKTNDTLCKFPGYSSTILTELYNDTDTPYVKFRYNGVYLNVCNNTNNTCTLKAYQDLVDQRLQGYNYTTWLNDCGISTKPDPTPQPKPPQPDDKGNSPTLLIVLVVIIGIVCIVELAVLISILRKSGKQAANAVNDASLMSA